MSEDLRIVRKTDTGLLVFFCPGCRCAHGVNTGWNFNGDYIKPTFTPSILVTGTETPTDEEVKRIMAGEKIEPRPTRCHTYVTNGTIMFLPDCTHRLAGQTVSLEPF